MGHGIYMPVTWPSVVCALWGHEGRLHTPHAVIYLTCRENHGTSTRRVSRDLCCNYRPDQCWGAHLQVINDWMYGTVVCHRATNTFLSKLLCHVHFIGKSECSFGVEVQVYLGVEGMWYTFIEIVLKKLFNDLHQRLYRACIRVT